MSAVKGFVYGSPVCAVPENGVELVEAGFECGIVQWQVGDEADPGVGSEKVGVSEGDPFELLVFFEQADGWEPVFKIEETSFNIRVEAAGQGGFDEVVELGAAQEMFADFSFGPTFSGMVDVPKPAFAAVFVVLKKLEDIGEFFDVFPAQGGL